MRLHVLGPHDRTGVVLARRPLVLGRDPQCDVVLHDPSVAARHALLQPVPQGVEVADFGGTSGLFLDGWAVKRALFTPGHVLRIGATEMTLDPRGEQVAAPVALPYAASYPAARPAPNGWAASPPRKRGGGLLAVIGILVLLAGIAGLGVAGFVAYQWVEGQQAASLPGGGGKPAPGSPPGARPVSTMPGAAADLEPLHFDHNPFEDD